LVSRNSAFRPKTSFWVQWTRMDASQLWFLEIVHSGPKHWFCIFLCAEGLQNTPKHSGTSDCRLHNFGTPNIVHLGPSRQDFHRLTCRRLAKCYETLPNIIFGPMEQIGCFTTSVPRNSAFSPNTRGFHLFTCRRLVKCSETLQKIILSPMD
jgi:hypothetical protein